MFRGKIIDPDLWNKQQRLFLLVMITNGVLIGFFADKGSVLFAVIFLPLFILLAAYFFQKKVLKRQVDLGVINISNEGILVSFSDKSESYFPKSELSSFQFNHMDMLDPNTLKEGIKAFSGNRIFPSLHFIYNNAPHQYFLLVDSDLMSKRLKEVEENWKG